MPVRAALRRRLAAAGRTASLAAVGLLLALGACAPVPPMAPDTRRSSTEDLSAALRALQTDDTQNPAMLWVAEGERRFASHCQACHQADSLRGAAARHPAWDSRLKRPLTLSQRIRQCHARAPASASQPASPAEALLADEAYLAYLGRGQRISPPDDRRLRPWLDEGWRLWRTRMGAIGLSCADCHDRLAGRRLAGSTIPQAHPTGYPIYRLEWQGMGGLERRLQGCLSGVRAEPFAVDAPQWVSLALVLKARAAGMALDGPGVRP